MSNPETGEGSAAGASPAPPVQETPAAAAGEKSRAGGSAGLDFVLDVPLRVSVEVGGARMLVRDVLQLGKGSVIELDRTSGEPADVFVNGRLVARGEVTVVEDRLAVRLVEVVSGERLERAVS